MSRTPEANEASEVMRQRIAQLEAENERLLSLVCKNARRSTHTHARWCKVERYGLHGANEHNCDCGAYSPADAEIKP